MTEIERRHLEAALRAYYAAQIPELTAEMWIRELEAEFTYGEVAEGVRMMAKRHAFASLALLRECTEAARGPREAEVELRIPETSGGPDSALRVAVAREVAREVAAGLRIPDIEAEIERRCHESD